MPRLPFRSDDASPQDLIEAVHARRGGALLQMDRLMLHSTAFTAGWNAFLKVVIEDLSIPARESQFVMCLIGVLNGTDYELASHAPRFLAAGGFQAQLDALTTLESDPASRALFSDREQAIIDLTVAMTREVKVGDAVFAAARAAMRDEEEMIDLIGLIATYNMVSRFVVALDVHPVDGRL